VRTFPRSLSTFEEIVNARGNWLRSLSYQELKALEDSPVEHLSVESRKATLSIVETTADSSLRIVVQGFMDGRLFGILKHVALDGFYKFSDGTIQPMPDDEFKEFD
jgi:hypothetical protein